MRALKILLIAALRPSSEYPPHAHRPPRSTTWSRRWCGSRPSSCRTAARSATSAASATAPASSSTSSGLVLTIGYLMVEAHAAEVITNAGRTVPATVVGYDHDTGFGLLRTLEPLGVKPLTFGKSADLKEKDRALVASFGGTGMVVPVEVVSQARVRRQLGIPGAGGDLHRAAASGLERSGADQPRGQARRRRLAGARRRRRRDGDDARQHVRADRSAAADPRRPAGRRPRVGVAQAVARRQRRRDRRPPAGQPRHAGKPGREVRASSAATSSSGSTARRPRRCRNSIASSGRAARPASSCRSTSNSAARRAASTCRPPTGSITSS